MNEHQLGRLLKRIVLLTAPLPAALLATACSGTTTSDPTGGAGEHTTAGSSSGGSGEGGSATGGTGTSGSATGGTGTGGSAGGTHNEGGSSSGASPGGAAGATHGGAGGVSGSGGAGGSGGNSGCRGPTQIVGCLPSTVTVTRSCLPKDLGAPGVLPLATCNLVCSQVPLLSCTLAAVSDATVSVTCQGACVTGRRPPGFCPAAFFETQALGKYFAQLSELEAASVDAFRILQSDLRAYGAPKRLVRAAGRAARDEIRHARTTRALARRSGSEPTPAARLRAPRRSLEAVARENAVEGCVRETFGALLATWQAKAASDPLVRAAMLRISRDETRHAALSWQVQHWLDTRLDPAARARVATARSDAALELLQAIRTETAPSFAERIGLPDRARSHELASELARALWS